MLSLPRSRVRFAGADTDGRALPAWRRRRISLGACSVVRVTDTGRYRSVGPGCAATPREPRCSCREATRPDASVRAGRARPSAGRTVPSGCRGTVLRASRRAAPARSAVRRRRGRSRRRRAAQTLEFVAQFGRESLFQFVDGRLVDLLEPRPAGVVERCGAHFLEELLDHRADAHHLRGLLDHLGDATRRRILVRGDSAAPERGGCLPRPPAREGSTVGADHNDGPVLFRRIASCFHLVVSWRDRPPRNRSSGTVELSGIERVAGRRYIG